MGGGSPSQSTGESESPLDGQPQGQEGQKEQTPGQPQPDDSEQEGRSGEPRGPRRSADEPENRPGGPPPGGETDRARASDVDERWGDLPIHVRDLFRVEGGGDLPPKYRDWIEAYYRRLNERP